MNNLQPVITKDIMGFSMQIAQKHVGTFQKALQDILARKAQGNPGKKNGE